MEGTHILTLSPAQLVDPQRGPFRVGAKPCKTIKNYRGERVHEDAFGDRFIIDPHAAPVAQVRL